MPNAETAGSVISSSPPTPDARRKRRWPRILLVCASVAVVLLIVAAGAGCWWIRSATRAALPVLDGDIHLAGVDAGGLSAPVTVRRDEHGVPHIEAANETDLFVAEGYVTAQDRLWQMDLLRRNANGELAEIFGPSQLAHDRAQRVLRIRATAHRIYSNMAATDRARLDAYARGVNLFIAQHQATLPPEFGLLFYRPRPWTGEDGISVGLTMVQGLDTHFDTKLVRERIAAKLNDRKLEADLYPDGSWRDHPPTGAAVEVRQPQAASKTTNDDEDEDDDDRMQTRIEPAFSAGAKQAAKEFSSSGFVKGRDFSRAAEALKMDGALAPAAVEDPHRLRRVLGLPDCEGCAAGSNNWVIGGRHTASGMPLLANDMHLGLLVPNIWYMADLKAPGYHVTGVTMPGTPGVIAGHNEHVAWGFTALYADVQDLYIEKVDGKGNYEGGDAKWHPLTVDRETIHVRGRGDVELDVQSTDHGPLLNPIFAREKRAIALKWTLLDPALNALPIYEMDKAANWAEFSAALEQWCWPTQNVVYSDDQGHIAYHAVGKVPLRWGGKGIFTTPLPHLTMNPRYEWGNAPVGGMKLQTYIPFDQLPNAFDPPSGFLATANSNVSSEKFPSPLTAEWIDPYRAERIYKILDGRDHLTPKDMLAVQTDIYSESDQELAHRLASAIDHADKTSAQLRKAADLMRNWDGRLSTDSAAASLLTKTRGELWMMLLEPKLGKELAGIYTWAEKNFAQEEIVMHASPEWLPAKYKNWDSFLAAAVKKAMKKGPVFGDVNTWAYGSWHVVDLEHPLATILPDLGHFAGTGPLPLSGDNTTVKQVGRAFGPSQRFTMDWSNVDGSTEDIVLGESGNPLSPYFRDQWKDYYGGTTFALPFSKGAVAAQARHTLRLLP
jgi:penicillin amidase